MINAGWYTEQSSMWPGQGLSLKIKEVRRRAQLAATSPALGPVCVRPSAAAAAAVLHGSGVCVRRSPTHLSLAQVLYRARSEFQASRRALAHGTMHSQLPPQPQRVLLISFADATVCSRTRAFALWLSSVYRG